jgi:geranylgeranyl pyrophosphate synthase
VPTTSEILKHTLMRLFPSIGRESEEITKALADTHPTIAQALADHGRFRAAYVIPQLFLDLSYSALTDRPLALADRGRAAAIPLMCLALAVADDLVDADDILDATDHSHRNKSMDMACVALAILDHAYALVMDDDEPNRRVVMSRALSSFVADVLRAAHSEQRYALERDFSLDAYLTVTATKSELYTRPSASLAHALSHSCDTLMSSLLSVGRNTAVALQILDDYLDASSDRRSGLAPTYPAFLIGSGMPLAPMYTLIDEHLAAAIAACSALPYPEHLLRLLRQMRMFVSIEQE